MDTFALRNAILRWANDESRIRAVVETGAGVRHDHPADEYSDLDIELFVPDVKYFASRSDWFEAFAPVWVYLPLHVDDGSPSRLVIFEGGAKVDFILYSAHKLSTHVLPDLPEIYRRGYKVLLDKDNLAAEWLPSPFSPPPFNPPTEEQFQWTVREFWFEAYHVAKYLRRGDLWSVKFRERGVKDLLLQTMEWHARCVRDISDTWHDGRFLRDWTDEKTWHDLHQAFGAFHAESSWQSLFVTINIFRRLANETAHPLQYKYPSDVDKNISGYIEKLKKS